MPSLIRSCLLVDAFNRNSEVQDKAIWSGFVTWSTEDIELRFMKGKKNSPADFLSRINEGQKETTPGNEKRNKEPIIRIINTNNIVDSHRTGFRARLERNEGEDVDYGREYPPETLIPESITSKYDAKSEQQAVPEIKGIIDKLTALNGGEMSRLYNFVLIEEILYFISEKHSLNPVRTRKYETIDYDGVPLQCFDSYRNGLDTVLYKQKVLLEKIASGCNKFYKEI